MCLSHSALCVGVLVLTLFQVFRSESSDWVPSCEHSFPLKNYSILLLSSALKSFICVAPLVRSSWKLLPLSTFWQVLRLVWRQERGFAPRWCRNCIHNCPEMWCCEIQTMFRCSWESQCRCGQEELNSCLLLVAIVNRVHHLCNCGSELPRERMMEIIWSHLKSNSTGLWTISRSRPVSEWLCKST